MSCNNCGKEFEKEIIDGMVFSKIPYFSLYELSPGCFCSMECMKVYYDEHYEGGALEKSIHVGG